MNCEEILRKLSRLRTLDGALSAFCASSHQYKLNAVASAAAIASFEQKHQVELSADYRDFLLYCGNGGAGPYYGLFPLGLFDGRGDDLEPWDGFAGILSRPFLHREAWNLPDDRLDMPEDLPTRDAEHAWHDALDREYWAPELTNGAFPICHQGCALRNLLVVSGPERGHIWLDSRADYRGIVPVTDRDGGRLSFDAWYSGWLDAALENFS
jgi:hypothetical protein